MIALYFVADDDHAAVQQAKQGPEGEETVESEVDPAALAVLDASITGRDVDELLADEDYPRVVTETANGSVVALDPTFRHSLADADLTAHLPGWLDSDDVEGADPEEMSDFVSDLATLCRDAGPGSGVYCWVSA